MTRWDAAENENGFMGVLPPTPPGLRRYFHRSATVPGTTTTRMKIEEPAHAPSARTLFLIHQSSFIIHHFQRRDI